MMQTVPDEEDTISVLKNPMLRKDSRMCTYSIWFPKKRGLWHAVNKIQSFIW